jgi:hypothetical protein
MLARIDMFYEYNLKTYMFISSVLVTKSHTS